MNGKTNANSSGGASTGISIPLEAPTNLALSAEDSKISLTWTDPNDKVTETYNELVSQWSYDSLVRKQGSAPTSITDGTLVAKITGKNQYQNIPYIDTGMENDKEWFYSVFAHNQFNTPSDPIYGSDIPTANVVTSYLQEILCRDETNGKSVDDYLIIDTNGSSIFILPAYTNEDTAADAYITIDKNFIKSTKVNTTIGSSDSDYYATTRIGTNLVVHMMYPYKTPPVSYNIDGFYIDANSVDHILNDFNACDNDINNGLLHVMSNVDYKAGYLLVTKQYRLNDVQSLGTNISRIDSNLTKTKLSSLKAYTHLSEDTLITLSSSNRCAFMGFSKEISWAPSVTNSNYKKIYLYDNDGLSRNLTLSYSGGWPLDNYMSTSRLDQYLLIFGTYNFANVIKEDTLVLSTLDPFIESDIIQSPSAPSDIQTIGIGLMLLFGDSIHGGGTYAGQRIVDKNLIYRDSDELQLPLTVSTFYGYNSPNPHNSIRLDKYLFIPITFISGYNGVDYTNNAKLIVIKNGYESDIEGG